MCKWLALYFLGRNGTSTTTTTSNNNNTKWLLIVELLGGSVATPWAITGPQNPGMELQALELLGCSTQKWARPGRDLWGSPPLLPLPPPLRSRGYWDLRDRQLFGPQPHFRYFLWERKWKLIQEQGFTKEPICLLDYLFACQSLSYGTG